jgi:CBS domain containing-hemolysin-like protein
MNMSGNSKRIERFLDVTLWVIIIGGIVLPLLGVGIAGQEWFGPGIGTPWALTPLLVLIGFLVMIPTLIIGISAGVLLWALCARLVAPPWMVRRYLFYPGVPFFSWYCRQVFYIVFGRDTRNGS